MADIDRPQRPELLTPVLTDDELRAMFANLVHSEVDLSEPRQQGKSVTAGAAGAFRSATLFGETQEILHIARDVGAAVNVQRPFRLRAERDERFKVRAAGGRLEIEYLVDGSRWLIRSSESVYSYSSTMVIADEAWDLSPEID